MWFVFRHWLPLALTATLLSGLVFAATRQAVRMNADTLPAQLADDAAYLLERGTGAASVTGMRAMELSRTRSPFFIVLNATGAIVAASAQLDGESVTPRPDILFGAQQTGEHRVTWEPREGLPLAVVIRRFEGEYPGYVVAGQSLLETEKNIRTLGVIVLIGWAATLLLSFLATWLLLPRRRRIDAILPRETPVMPPREPIGPVS